MLKRPRACSGRIHTGIFGDTVLFHEPTRLLGTWYKSNTEDRCISYNSVEKTITIRCGTNNRLTDIHNTIQDRNVIDRLSDGIWLLNAGIIIERGASLLMDPQDTK
ncbi:MAG: hypothetical protein WBP64_04235 [Nitrososphaeraceae archaeon]